VAKATEHIALANINHATLVYLLKDYANHPEWIATVAFYKAVQIVEAVLAHKQNWHSADHRLRLGKVKTTMPDAVYKHLNALYGKSRIARYLQDETGAGFVSFTSHISAEDVVKHLVGRRLVGLEQLCSPELPQGNGLQQIHAPDLPI